MSTNFNKLAASLTLAAAGALAATPALAADTATAGARSGINVGGEVNGGGSSYSLLGAPVSGVSTSNASGNYINPNAASSASAALTGIRSNIDNANTNHGTVTGTNTGINTLGNVSYNLTATPTNYNQSGANAGLRFGNGALSPTSTANTGPIDVEGSTASSYSGGAIAGSYTGPSSASNGDQVTETRQQTTYAPVTINRPAANTHNGFATGTSGHGCFGGNGGLYVGGSSLNHTGVVGLNFGESWRQACEDSQNVMAAFQAGQRPDASDTEVLAGWIALAERSDAVKKGLDAAVDPAKNEKYKGLFARKAAPAPTVVAPANASNPTLVLAPQFLMGQGLGVGVQGGTAPARQKNPCEVDGAIIKGTIKYDSSTGTLVCQPG